jgi:hypothetical protein
MRRSEAGQATIEWTGLVLLAALVLAGAGVVTARSEPWGLGSRIIDSIVCAVDSCADALDDVYGDDVAHAVRRYAPNIVYEHRSAELPIDFRRCRRLDCSNGPRDAEEVEDSESGLPVTAFTHVLDRREAGGALYLQYWVYFPESFTGALGRRLGPLSSHWPGYHPDDWEGYQVRIAPDGNVSARATAHGGYRNTKDAGGWGRWTGWYRISGGSHAGHLIGGPTDERTTLAEDLRLVPVEQLGDALRERFEVAPPWQKDVYRDPESAGS